MRSVAIFLACVLLLLSIAGSCMLVLSYSGYKDLKSAREEALQGDLVDAKRFSSAAQSKFKILTATLNFLKPEDTLAVFFSGAQDISEGFSGAIYSYTLLSDFVESVVSGEKYDTATIVEAGLSLRVAKEKIAHGKTKISSAQKQPLFLRNGELEKIENELVYAISLMDKTEGIIEILPKIIPQNERKKYLILLQNNMELRPTGGFIGSFALLTLDGGKILEFTILDVYDADGQLKGHVEPPMPIRKYLGLVNWFLRDSNFNPDFQESSKMAAWFLEKEMGVKVDGVFAIDVHLAESLLKELKEVKLVDYGETINAENVFLKANQYTQQNFFPGSKQKKNFLGSLTKAILDKLGQSHDKLTLMKVLHGEAEEKHALFSFFDPSIQSVFAINNWDGALVDRRTRKENAFNDFLAIREANMGINKTNFFVKRSIAHNIEIKKDGTFEQAVIITYDNSSGNQEIGGEYKNYLRVYIPKIASLKSIDIDGKKATTTVAETNPLIYEKKTFAKSLGGKLEVEIETDERFAMIGFLVEIPRQSQKTVSLTYTLPAVPSKEFLYSLLVSKQPGTNNDPYVLSVNYPSSFRAGTNDPSALVREDRIVIPTNLAKDQAFEVELLKRE